jgi:hypothetical protein
MILIFIRTKLRFFKGLNDRHMANHRISSEQLLEILNDNGVINTVLMTDEEHFHLSGYVNKVITTGHLKIHKNSISVPSTAKG